MQLFLSPLVRGLAVVSVLALLSGAAAAPARAEGQPDPADAQRLVQETTEELLALLREQAADGDIDVEMLRAKVDELVEPHLDFVTMTRLAVGRHWRDASDDQKRDLVREFRELVTRTYSSALEQVEDYDGQRIEFLPQRESPHEDRTEVRSKVIQPDGSEIPVNYGLRYRDGSWQLYDIAVDGISLVTTYRSGFGTVVSRNGIDGLIDDLRKKNERGETEVPDIDGS